MPKKASRSKRRADMPALLTSEQVADFTAALDTEMKQTTKSKARQNVEALAVVIRKARISGRTWFKLAEFIEAKLDFKVHPSTLKTWVMDAPFMPEELTQDVKGQIEKLDKRGKAEGAKRAVARKSSEPKPAAAAA